MRIGIDISQIVFEDTGVGNYVRRMVAEIIKQDKKNEYILFGASLRKKSELRKYFNNISHLSNRVQLVTVPIPPTLLDFFWNRLHIIPVEWFTGPIDVFWSSDWTQPPLAGARGVTTIHDLSVLRYPEESHNRTQIDVSSGRVIADIVLTQRRRLTHAAKECVVFFCDSEATKRDTQTLLSIAKHKLHVVYPGFEGKRI